MSHRPDWLFRVASSTIALLYVAHIALDLSSIGWLARLAHSTFELINTVWWGILLGIVTISLLGKVPREFVMRALGTRTGMRGIARATAAGVLLDLCSHGVLMVGAKLYERGASAGQTMAFLIASPWNSLSLTLILIALIGPLWTLIFIAISALIAIISGWLVDLIVARTALPTNTVAHPPDDDFDFWREAKTGLSQLEFSPQFFTDAFVSGFMESRMILRWIFLGLLMASGLRTFLTPDLFNVVFAPTMLGLGTTLAVATILEVCSEGSSPVAADIVNRAEAPGNGFAFLMGGVATDYTEIMVLKETMGAWGLAFLLPVVTLPQVLVIGWLLNIL